MALTIETLIASRVAKLPYGESANTLNAQSSSNPGGRGANNGYVAEGVRQGFGGYEEDAETGLDYAQARYFASSQGRFTAVDPLMASANPGNPQTWNRYSYTINNPLRYTDPTGLVPNDYATADYYGDNEWDWRSDTDDTPQGHQQDPPPQDVVMAHQPPPVKPCVLGSSPTCKLILNTDPIRPEPSTADLIAPVTSVTAEALQSPLRKGHYSRFLTLDRCSPSHFPNLPWMSGGNPITICMNLSVS